VCSHACPLAAHALQPCRFASAFVGRSGLLGLPACLSRLGALKGAGTQSPPFFSMVFLGHGCQLLAS